MTTSTLILLTTFVFLSLSKDNNILPTTSNSTGDYYIASSNNFKYGTIACDSLNCYIECAAYQSCQGLSINNIYQSSVITIECTADSACYYGIFDVTASAIFTLKCTDQLSCLGVKLIASSPTSGNISCAAIGACKSANFSLETAININIACDATDSAQSSDAACYSASVHASKSSDIRVTCGGYDCQLTNFYVNNSKNAYFEMNGQHNRVINYIYGSSIIESLTLTCFGENGCGGTTVGCPISTYCNVNCMDDDSCSLTISIVDYIPQNQFKYLNLKSYAASNAIHVDCPGQPASTSTLQYQSLSDNWKCDYYGCCPYSDGDIQCNSTDPKNCSIYCNDGMDGKCQNKNIYGMDGKSLTLYCYDDYSCEGVNVLCPSNDNTSCNVICSGLYSCIYSYINLTASIMDALNVSCSGQTSCYQMTLSANSVSEINTVSFDCSTYESCSNQYIDFSGVALITHLLHFSTMDTNWHDTTIIAPSDSVSTFNLEVDYMRDFEMSQMTITNSVNIECLGRATCVSATFDLILMDNANVNIICNNPSIATKDYEAACYSTNFLIAGGGNKNNNVSVSCNQYDCSDTVFHFTNVNQVDIECFAPNSCQSADIDVAKLNLLSVGCRNEYSCEYADIDCYYMNKDVCSVTCGTESACYSMQINAHTRTQSPSTSNLATTTHIPTSTPELTSHLPTTRPLTSNPTTYISSISTPTSSPTSSSKLSTGTGTHKLFIWIGIIVGVMLIIIVGVLVIYMMNKKRKTGNENYSKITIPMIETIK